MIPGVPVHITPLTPLAFLERSASVFAERTAVVDGEDRATYAELAAEVTRAAHALRASGVGPGDRVGYLCPNARALLVADAELSGTVAPVIDRLDPVAEVVWCGGAPPPDLPGTAYADLLARGSDDSIAWTVDDEDATISINYTSGTTGDPKGVMYTPVSYTHLTLPTTSRV